MAKKEKPSEMMEEDDEKLDKAEVYLDAQMQRLKWERQRTAEAKISMAEWSRRVREQQNEDRAYRDAEIRCALPDIEGKDVFVVFPTDQRLDGRVVRVTRHHIQVTDGEFDYYIGWDAAPYIGVLKGKKK